jgi:integrase
VVDVDVITIDREIRDPLIAANKLVSANKVLTTLTTFWRWAANRKYASPEVRSPAELAERVRISADQRRQRGPQRVYKPDEIREIITAADSLKFKVAFALLSLGARREEVLGFKWSDVSPAWDSIRVQRAVTLAKGPGETNRIAKLKNVKSAAGDRSLPLPPPITTILKKWRLQCPANDLDLILPSDAGGILHPSTLYDALKRAQASSGVRKLDIKAFRHTFATVLIEGGEVDTQVARLMGHADTTVTRRIYAHAFDRPEGSRVAAEFAEAIFNQQSKASKA